MKMNKLARIVLFAVWAFALVGFAKPRLSGVWYKATEPRVTMTLLQNNQLLLSSGVVANYYIEGDLIFLINHCVGGAQGKIQGDELVFEGSEGKMGNAVNGKWVNESGLENVKRLAQEEERRNRVPKAIRNNLRQLAAAADQYFLENGVTIVTFEKLVGPEPGKYIKEIGSVAGEKYPEVYKQGEPVTATGVPGLGTMTYAP